MGNGSDDNFAETDEAAEKLEAEILAEYDDSEDDDLEDDDSEDDDSEDDDLEDDDLEDDDLEDDDLEDDDSEDDDSEDDDLEDDDSEDDDSEDDDSDKKTALELAQEKAAAHKAVALKQQADEKAEADRLAEAQKKADVVDWSKPESIEGVLTEVFKDGKIKTADGTEIDLNEWKEEAPEFLPAIAHISSAIASKMLEPMRQQLELLQGYNESSDGLDRLFSEADKQLDGVKSSEVTATAEFQAFLDGCSPELQEMASHADPEEVALLVRAFVDSNKGGKGSKGKKPVDAKVIAKAKADAKGKKGKKDKLHGGSHKPGRSGKSSRKGGKGGEGSFDDEFNKLLG